MKKILTAMAALAMVAGFASCQKENDSVNGSAENGFNEVTVKASMPEASKVTYSENGNNALTPAWEENDKILVINEDNSASMLKVTEINGSVATLEGEAKNGQAHLVYMEGVNTSSWVSNKIEFSYDNQSGNNDMPAVMLADGEISNGSGEFMFNNAGAVIGIYNAKGVDASSAISKVTVSGSNLSKATISINDDALILTATEKADDAISTAALSGITVDATEARALNTPIFIAVPAGAKVAKVTLAVGTATYTYTLAAAKECKANDYLYIKTSAFKKDLPAGALPGVFTVSDDNGVTKTPIHFSQGNLVATIDANGAPTAWKFAANQYGYIGNSVANTSIGKTAGDVDLFGWSTDAASNNWGIHTKASQTPGFTTGDFKDWSDTIDDKGTWRTLSKAEWQSLFNTRTMANGGARYENLTKNGITVEGVTFKGVVLFPDDFTDQADWKTKYTTWEALNNAGLVFLPAAGYREGSKVSYPGDIGRYWSSTRLRESYAYFVHFNNVSVSPNEVGVCCIGYSVRLITECQ